MSLPTHPAWRYAAVACVALAIALALGIPEYGLGVRALPQLVAVFLGAGIASLLLGLTSLANGNFALGGLAAYVIMQSTAATAEVGVEARGIALGGSLDIEQYSTANLTATDSSAFAVLTSSSADVIAIQGLTPDWAAALEQRLGADFPSQYLFPDIGVTGLGIFSRKPLQGVDTVLIGGIVQVRACHPLPGSEADVEILAVQTLPPLSRESSLGLQAQLDHVSEALVRGNRPLILVGDLNAVPWSPVINRFTERAGLRDSRRNELPSYDGGMPGLFETPVEHIFYNDALRCVRFETVRSAKANYLGNRASFQSADAATQVVAL